MSIYKRKSGRYAVVVAREAGSLKRASLGTFRTRREAEAAERDALTARERGIDVSPATITVADLLLRFIADRESLGRGRRTVEKYRRLADLYVIPRLGSIVVGKLKPARVSEWIAQLQASGDHNGRRISATTARHAFALLNSALRRGAQLEIAGRNVCAR